MTKQEQEALLGYIEFNLTTMVEQNEITLREKFSLSQDTITDIVGIMYDSAYEVLHEMERSYDEVNQMMVNQKNKQR